jgi:hypothetical protein
MTRHDGSSSSLTQWNKIQQFPKKKFKLSHTEKSMHVKNILIFFSDFKAIFYYEWDSSDKQSNEEFYLQVLEHLQHHISWNTNVWPQKLILHSVSGSFHTILSIQQFLTKKQIPALEHQISLIRFASCHLPYWKDLEKIIWNADSRHGREIRMYEIRRWVILEWPYYLWVTNKIKSVKKSD